jgi:hypothetical protein
MVAQTQKTLIMNLVIIDDFALSLIDKVNLKELNREHHPVIVVVVDSHGYSKRYKLREDTIETFIADIPTKYLMIR